MTELSIKLRIGNREYPMRVNADEEEMIRKAGKILNEKMKSYADRFGIQDQQDLIAMVAFDCQVEKMKSEKNVVSTDGSSLNQLKTLNQMISEVL